MWLDEKSEVAQMVKRLPTMGKTQVQSLGWEDLLEKEMATHFSTLAWKILGTEESDRLQSMGSQRVRHNWVTSLSLFTFSDCGCHPWHLLTYLWDHWIVHEVSIHHSVFLTKACIIMDLGVKAAAEVLWSNPACIRESHPQKPCDVIMETLLEQYLPHRSASRPIPGQFYLFSGLPLKPTSTLIVTWQILENWQHDFLERPPSPTTSLPQAE